MKLIYDGNNIAYRCNSVNDLYNKAGKRTSAIYGVLNSVKKDIEELESRCKAEVDEILFAWDFGKSKRRMDLYPEYKGNRKKDSTPEDRLWFEEFIEQANYLHENLEYFGIKSIKIKGWEADDIVKALTDCLILNGKSDIVIVSTDEDYYQIINQHVAVYSPIKKLMFNNVNFVQQFGIPLQYYVEYKCIKGDSSDNINGINGLGEVLTKNLLNDYKGLKGVYANKAELQKSKRYAKIFNPEGQQLIQRNDLLINLNHVDYSSIQTQIDILLNTEAELDKKAVINILRDNQMTTIFAQFNQWIKPFERVASH